MSLKTYVKVEQPASVLWPPLYRVGDDGKPDKLDRSFAPGDTVCHVEGDGSGHGMVIAVAVDQVCVLWSVEPKQRNDFANVAFPVVRRTHVNLMSQQLVSIQPMTAPTGLIFYLDHTYGAAGSVGPTGSSGQP